LLHLFGRHRFARQRGRRGRVLPLREAVRQGDAPQRVR
jgi:hypothetical protein